MKTHELINALKGATYYLLPICRECFQNEIQRLHVTRATADLLVVLSELDEQLDGEVGIILQKVVDSLYGGRG
jgi:hypothetical protein